MRDRRCDSSSSSGGSSRWGTQFPSCSGTVCLPQLHSRRHRGCTGYIGEQRGKVGAKLEAEPGRELCVRDEGGDICLKTGGADKHALLLQALQT